MSQITTHILDTSRGQPAAGVPVRLESRDGLGRWAAIGSGTTNADGRVANLLPEGKVLSPGVYRMYFETGKYFAANGTKAFYPFVAIVFETMDSSHYHVPLLLNPFGYSTYRGS